MRSELDIAAEYDACLWDVNHNMAGLEFANFNAYVDFLKESLLKKLNVVNNDINGL